MILNRALIFGVLLGCFGAPAAAAAAADAPGVTNDSIKIGMFGPITSQASVFAKVLYGAEAIFKDINEHGGINGRKLDLVVEDDACEPEKGVAAVKKLIEDDKVFLLHGAWCSSVALAVKPEIVKHRNVPYIVLGAGSAAISTPLVPNLFHPIATSQTVADAIVEFALTKPGAKSIAIVTQPEDGPQAQYRGALAQLKSHGLEPVETAIIKNGSPDASEQVLAIKAKQPDAVLAILYPPELAIFVRDAYRHGLRTAIVTVQGASIDDTDKRVGIRDALKDLYFFYPLNDTLTSPSMAKYAKIFRKYYPGEALDTIGFMGMGGALAIAESIKRAGRDLTQEAVIAQLNNLRDFDPGIQASPITFSATDHAGIKSGKMICLVNNRPVVVDRYPAASR